METFTVRKLAALAGVGAETIRFYERRGLLPQPARNASGYRKYSASDVERIIFIRRAKDLGFTLREIKSLIALREDPDSTCGQVLELADRKALEIDRRIASLKSMQETLGRLTARCVGSRGHCALLEALARPEPQEALDRA